VFAADRLKARNVRYRQRF